MFLIGKFLLLSWYHRKAAPHSDTERCSSALRPPFLAIAIVELTIQIERCADESEMRKGLREIASELRLGIKLLGI
jgi:hypothetical protein